MIFLFFNRSCDNYCRKEKSRAFTLIEFAVVVAILGILGGTLLNRIVFYQEQAELVAVQRMVATLRTALSFQIARLRIDNRRGASLAEENPMSWLVEPPSNYLGEFSDAKVEDFPKGSWFFDIKKKNLIFLLSSETKFPNKQGNLLKFKVKLPTSTNLPDASTEGASLDQVDD